MSSCPFFDATWLPSFSINQYGLNIFCRESLEEQITLKSEMNFKVWAFHSLSDAAATNWSSINRIYMFEQFLNKDHQRNIPVYKFGWNLLSGLGDVIWSLNLILPLFWCHLVNFFNKSIWFDRLNNFCKGSQFYQIMLESAKQIQRRRILKIGHFPLFLMPQQPKFYI